MQCYGQCLGCNDCPTNQLWFLHCLGSASVQIHIQQRENHLLAKFSWSPKPWSSKMIHLGHQMGDNYLKLRCFMSVFDANQNDQASQCDGCGGFTSNRCTKCIQMWALSISEPQLPEVDLWLVSAPDPRMEIIGGTCI